MKLRKTSKSLSVIFCVLLLCSLIALYTGLSSANATERDAQGTLRDPRLELIGLMMNVPRSIAVGENVVAALSDSNLYLLDTTDVTFPRILSQLILPDGASPQERGTIILRDVVIADNHAYVTWLRCPYTCSGGGLQILDISVPTAPVVIGNLDVGLDALDTTMTISGSKLYLSSEGDLAVVDVSNPAEPSILGSVPIANQYDSMTAIKVHEDDGQLHAFVSANGALYVVDVTDASAPTQIAVFEPSGSEISDVALVQSGETLYAYLPDFDAGLRVADVSDPANPTEAYTYTLPGNVYRIAVNDRWALVATSDGSPIENTTVHKLDLSNPGTPVIQGAYEQVAFAQDMFVADDALVIADNVRGVQFVGLVGTLAMTKIGGQDVVKAYSDIAIEGHYLFVVDDNGLQVIDIFNPVLPAYVAEFETPFALSVTVDGGYALVTDSEGGLWVLNIRYPFEPTLVGYVDLEMSNTSDVEIIGELDNTLRVPLIFIAGRGCDPFSCQASLKMVNFSDPAEPQVTSVFDDGRGVSNMTLAGDYMYASIGLLDADTHDLAVLDISEPTQPIAMSTTTLPGRCEDIVIAGQYAYVALLDEILVFDVSDPSAPAEVGSYAGVSRINSMVSSDNLLYVTDRYDQLSVLNVSSPISPTLIEVYALPVENTEIVTVDSLLAKDGFVYVLNNGLSIWRHRDDVLGRALDAWGQPFSGVTIQADAQAIAASGVSGGYAPTDELFGSRTLSAHIGSLSAWPLTQTVNLDESARAQSFYVVAQPISALVQPGVSTTLGYVDTQGLPTEILFPPGAVSQARAVRLTPTMAFHRGAQQFVGNAFELAATDGMGEDTFGAPLQVSIRYSDLGLRVVDETTLTLMAESNGTWVEATSLCQEPLEYARDLDGNTLDAFICTWGRFALYGETKQLYLPMITH